MRARMLLVLVFCFFVAAPSLAQDAQAGDSAAEPDVVAEVAVPETTSDPVDAELAVDESVADASPETIVIPIVDPVDDPSTGDEVVDAVQKVKEAWYSKSFPAIAGAIIFLILTLFRLPLLGSLTKKIPARIRVLAAVALSFLAAFFQVMALGASWNVALMNVLGTGSAAVFANELFVETILGKRYKKEETPASTEKKPS